jgi:hypothetical protein
LLFLAFSFKQIHHLARPKLSRFLRRSTSPSNFSRGLEEKRIEQPYRKNDKNRKRQVPKGTKINGKTKEEVVWRHPKKRLRIEKGTGNWPNNEKEEEEKEDFSLRFIIIRSLCRVEKTGVICSSRNEFQSKGITISSGTLLWTYAVQSNYLSLNLPRLPIQKQSFALFRVFFQAAPPSSPSRSSRVLDLVPRSVIPVGTRRNLSMVPFASSAPSSGNHVRPS